MHAPRETGEQWTSAYHAPVLVAEVLAVFVGARRVLDGTLGGGGHAAALLAGGAHVTGLDRDPDALVAARERLWEYGEMGEGDGGGKGEGARFLAVPGNFANVDEIGAIAGVQFDGILLDLGVSSHQLDSLDRGFSFREGTPLDMRMAGAEASVTAAALLAELDERELGRIFREYADEPRAMRLAREIVRRRANRPLETSDDLVGAIRGALGPRTGPGDFARLFQAVRIAVNDEMEALAEGLPRLRERLTSGGILAVITYHSGEDRLVKRAFREWSAACICPPRHPVCSCRGAPLGELVAPRGVTSTAEEVARNPRARSARMRAWRRAA
ncbi:MAG TPA: 16S rRNA (cytosine(1402)-N(4))-methyltransferase RsmH [Gemmatimonadaceae bacterium]|nr:16S rRNA (cytosine(1402)-N(4))-methyltransferase RsmH [Gemmatimonadaceae bacterium]